MPVKAILKQFVRALAPLFLIVPSKYLAIEGNFGWSHAAGPATIVEITVATKAAIWNHDPLLSH